jgi:phosphoribosylformylglycinamidine synthase
VKSCHDPSTGGLLVAAAEMAFGGDLGFELDIGGIGGLRTDFKLFSESNSRWLVEVDRKDAAEFEEKVEAKRIGAVTKEKEIRVTDGIKTRLRLSLEDLRGAWNTAIEGEA